MVTAYSYASVGQEHYVLTPTLTSAGAIVARTMDDVLDGVATWPGNVYELRVEPRDVIDQGTRVLRVRTYDVVRVVPRELAFGDNVTKLDAFIAELRTFGWLRPSTRDRGAQAAILVAEHYTALGHYGRIRSGGSRIVRDLDAVDPMVRSPFPVAAQDGLAARRAAYEAATRAVDRKIRARLKEAVARCVSGVLVHGAWRAAWKHITAAHLEYALAFIREEEGPMLEDATAGLIERFATAMDAAMETGLEELAAMGIDRFKECDAGRPPVDRTIVRAQAEFPPEWSMSKLVSSLVQRIWFLSWRFTTHASSHAAWHAFRAVSGLREPDLWAPWVGLFRIGLWPVADNGVDMMVYEPPATGE